jgi:hypothetical protein
MGLVGVVASAAADGMSAVAQSLEERAKAGVDQAHAELWRRFVDEHDTVLDYVDQDGKFLRPTPAECREMKPNALSWGVPVEDGPMFNGLYMDAAVNRWKQTRDPADRAKARRLLDGLMFLASRGVTPGYIARGVADDGVTTYPMGSNDQTMPWLYGVWRYLHDEVPETDGERRRLIKRFREIVELLEHHDWRMPCERGPSKYRGDFTKATWEGAPRMLFVLKAMHFFTGEIAWGKRYREAVTEKIGKSQTTRLEICRTGMVFDPGQGPRHSWTGSVGVTALRALWEMETDADLKAAYAAGLRGSAELSAKSLGLIDKFDVNGTEVFNHDWHVMMPAWEQQQQQSEQDAVEVANAGLRLQHKASPRLHLENDYMREPCFAAWVVTLCPDEAYVRTHREAILKVLAHYRYDRLNLSQFFPVEAAWFRLPSKE